MFLNMNRDPIIVNVDQDCAELTAKRKVLNLSYFLLHEELKKKKTHTCDHFHSRLYPQFKYMNFMYS